MSNALHNKSLIIIKHFIDVLQKNQERQKLNDFLVKNNITATTPGVLKSLATLAWVYA